MSEITKPKIIEEILKITKGDPEKYFDRLSDHSKAYLETLLKVCVKLKKNAVQSS